MEEQIKSLKQQVEENTAEQDRKVERALEMINMRFEIQNKKHDEVMAKLDRFMMSKESMPPQSTTADRSANETGNNFSPRPLNFSPKCECPKFDGTSPLNWIRTCTKYFDLYKIPINQRVDVASLHMTGKAEEWMCSYMSVGRVISWPEFVNDLTGRFRDNSGDEVENDVLKETIEPGERRNQQLETEKVSTIIAPELFDESPKKEKSECDSITHAVAPSVLKLEADELVIDSKLTKLLGADGEEFFTSYDEVHDIGLEVALDVVSHLVGTDEEIVDRYDLYGGFDRLLSQVIPKTGAVVNYPITKLDEVAFAIGPWIKLMWLELHNIAAVNVREMFVLIFDPGGTFDVSFLTICDAAMGTPNSQCQTTLVQIISMELLS